MGKPDEIMNQTNFWEAAIEALEKIETLQHNRARDKILTLTLTIDIHLTNEKMITKNYYT